MLETSQGDCKTYMWMTNAHDSDASCVEAKSIATNAIEHSESLSVRRDALRSVGFKDIVES